jgi:uncharacterized membrane protein YtjA (UPF0391 family)
MGLSRPVLQTNPPRARLAIFLGSRGGFCSAISRNFPHFPARNLRFRNGLFSRIEEEVRVMLSWVVTFLIIALIAGVLGFGGLAGASIEIAKTIFFIAVILFLVSAVVGLARGRTRV